MGLLDTLTGLSPEQNQGLLAAAAQMLQMSGPSRTPTSFGQAVGGGLEAYQGAMTAAKRRKQEEEQARQMAEMRALQMQEAQGGLQDREAARQQAAQLQALNAEYAQGQPQAQPSMPPLGAQPMASMPGQQQQPAAPQPQGEYQERMRYAQFLRSKNMIPQANAEALEALKFRDEFDTTERVGNRPDGTPFKYVIDKQGNIKELTGVLPRDEMKLADTGGGLEAYNSFALKPGQKFTKTLTTGDKVSMRNANMADDRSRERAALEGQRFAAGMKPMTALQETKYRTQIAKDYQSANTILSNMDEVAKSAKAVKEAPGLGGATGLQAYFPSYPDSPASQAEVKLQNLEGKITNLGKAAAAMSGAVGPMAVQEWKIVRDMVAAIDPKKGKESLKEQIALVEETAQGAANRIRDAYSKHYSADFERYPQFENIGGKPANSATGAVRKYNPATGRIE